MGLKFRLTSMGWTQKNGMKAVHGLYQRAKETIYFDGKPCFWAQDEAVSSLSLSRTTEHSRALLVCRLVTMY
jgi:hypothetical protein